MTQNMPVAFSLIEDGEAQGHGSWRALGSRKASLAPWAMVAHQPCLWHFQSSCLPDTSGPRIWPPW